MTFKNQEIYSGYGSYRKIPEILQNNNVKKPLLVCDSAFDFLFIKDYIKGLDADFVYFSEFTPNPLYEDIKKGVCVFRENNCDFIISIGGGSAIDVAKCIKLYAKMDDSINYLEQEYTDSKIPHLAVPTTAGTGSESTRYAVCYYEGNKQSVTHESIIPDFVVLEPQFLETLPQYQKKATLLDALCQGIESLWSVNSTEESMEYSKEAIKAILANVEAYFRNEKSALEKISVAANMAGKAINITQTTAAHAMSYKVTSLYGLAHGHAAAVCLPYVWRYMIENVDKCIDPRGSEHLLKIFYVLDELFYVDESKQAVYRFFRLLKYLEVEFPKLSNPSDMDVLVKSVNPVRLKNNPVALDEKAITEIYTNVFCVGNNFQKKNIEKFLKKYHTTYEVAELQQISLNTLKYVDEFCRKHNIKYFLAEGTLLGAVRHKGFIPWDDDIDICMMREDYDRFIECAKADLDDKYVLDCFETNDKHWTICAKLLINEKSKFSIKRLRNIALSTYPGIDIFALDNAPASAKEKSRCANKIRALRVMLWLKTGYSHDYSTFKWFVLKILSFFYTVKGLQIRIDKLMRKYNGSDSDEVINYGSLYPAEKECFQKKLFSESDHVEFEGCKFPAPKGYKEVLKNTYNDFESLPPYSKRFPKHSFFVGED